MRVVVLQTNYIPWKGYFDLMSSGDVFITYDSAQYTKNDWRNRNILNGPNGPIWLTIPIETKNRPLQRIDEARVIEHHWTKKHWETIRQTLSKRPHFSAYQEEWKACYERANSMDRLHEINVMFLETLARQFGITTEIKHDSEFEYGGSNATERLVNLCVAAGATSYVTGPAGMNYIEADYFAKANIELELIDYANYVLYDQGRVEFLPGVTALDLLANVGPDANKHLLRQTIKARA